MPFTATHVAAVLPVAWLCKWRLPLSGLAIGSMVPDVAGYFPQIFDYDSTHSFRGVFTHCVPIGILVFFCFHWLFKQPLADLLPRKLSNRLAGWSSAKVDLRPSRVLIVVGCVVVGAITHIAWDAFTHVGGWGVSLVPSLQRIALDYKGHEIPVFAIIQHASSLVLLPPLLLGFLWWALHQVPPDTVSKRVSMPRSISWPFIVSLAIGGWIYFHSLQANNLQATWVAALRTAVKHWGAATIVLFILYSVGMHLAWWYQDKSERDEMAEPVTRGLDSSGSCAIDPAHVVLRPSVVGVPHGEVMLADSTNPKAGPTPKRHPSCRL